jgi:uncharacterized protein YhhL (DUF1145 family)
MDADIITNTLRKRMDKKNIEKYKVFGFGLWAVALKKSD